MIGNGCGTNVAGRRLSIAWNSSLEGVVRTRIHLSYHIELEDLDTPIALTHEGEDGLRRKKTENWTVDST
jgi:hypothetical protein